MTDNLRRPITPVILSGGEGTRLWPISRTLYPKQLQPLTSEQSLLQEAIARLSGPAFAPPIIVCNEEHRFIVAEQARAAGCEGALIVLEPAGRNTAPAVALAALLAAETNPEALLLVAPSDHVVRDTAAFAAAAETAAIAAAAGHLVTFGVTPTRPETGYGYIKRGDALDDAAGCCRVAAFVEKPDAETAAGYLRDGSYLWNSGMFLFAADTFLSELDRCRPEMAELCRAAIAGRRRDLDFQRPDVDAFTRIDGDSIDYAVMEKTERAAVVPVDMGWSDVGSWGALWEIGARDADGNVTIGDVVVQESAGSYIRSDGPLVAAVGVADSVIVATDDAVLVTTRAVAHKVKELVATLKADARAQSASHSRVFRPWGWYQTLDMGDGFQVKLIGIAPGGRISLQRHHRRAEHWVVVAGTAKVTRGEKVFELSANESTYIPIGTVHRLENDGAAPLLIVEVQTGGYLGEDDIERLDDQYGRN